MKFLSILIIYKKVYIIRYGEVPHNALKQYNNENEDLTKKGI